MQYLIHNLQPWSPEQKHWLGWTDSQGKSLVVVRVDNAIVGLHTGILGLECRSTPNKLVVVGLINNPVNYIQYLP